MPQVPEYHKVLLVLWNLSLIGYYLTSLVQFKENIKNKNNFLEIMRLSVLLELPKEQLEGKGLNRKNLISSLIGVLEHFS